MVGRARARRARHRCARRHEVAGSRCAVGVGKHRRATPPRAEPCLKGPPMRAPIWICAEENSRRQQAPCNASDGECGWPQMRTSRCVRPNVAGNRRAALTRAEDQGVCRRVRLTVRLGGGLVSARTHCVRTDSGKGRYRRKQSWHT
jgi:hypothetical protein